MANGSLRSFTIAAHAPCRKFFESHTGVDLVEVPDRLAPTGYNTPTISSIHRRFIFDHLRSDPCLSIPARRNKPFDEGRDASTRSTDVWDRKQETRRDDARSIVVQGRVNVDRRDGSVMKRNGFDSMRRTGIHECASTLEHSWWIRQTPLNNDDRWALSVSQRENQESRSVEQRYDSSNRPLSVFKVIKIW